MNRSCDIDGAMATSPVTCLLTDSTAADTLGAAADGRREHTVNGMAVGGDSRGSVLWATTDCEKRGRLVRQGEETWHVPEAAVPPAVPAFHAEMEVAKRAAADEEEAQTAVTLPALPSVIADVLPETRLTYASLLSTQGGMARIADAATPFLAVMPSFPNEGGRSLAAELFSRTPAKARTLVVRGSHRTWTALDKRRNELTSLGAAVLDYRLPSDDGREALHTKNVLAADMLVCVESANFLVHLRRPQKLGCVLKGRAARGIASVVRAVKSVLPSWN